jgi:hypothetical protein
MISSSQPASPHGLSRSLVFRAFVTVVLIVLGPQARVAEPGLKSCE